MPSVFSWFYGVLSYPVPKNLCKLDLEVNSRFKRLPEPRLATAHEADRANRLTPAFPEELDLDRGDSDWSTSSSVAGGSGASSGGSKGRSDPQAKPDQEEKKEQEEQGKKKGVTKDIDWQSMLIALGILLLLFSLIFGAWYFGGRRKK